MGANNPILKTVAMGECVGNSIEQARALMLAHVDCMILVLIVAVFLLAFLFLEIIEDEDEGEGESLSFKFRLSLQVTEIHLLLPSAIFRRSRFVLASHIQVLLARPEKSSMGRWSEYDTDAERLPEGMTRIGYDADDETYTFRDADGSVWESAPGNQYGPLHRISTALPIYGDDDGDENDTAPMVQPSPSEPTAAAEQLSWRQEMQPLLNWFLLVGLFLLLVFWIITRRSSKEVPVTCPEHTLPYTIRSGDTCWAIAEGQGLSVEELLHQNQGLDCDKLRVGDTLCLPGV
ncbi:hypothetical protein F4778DRAFT_786285 [Xylariomycetidae sp. FL2044]|nr:hypothetical protein F4778DRAFT_786285 [Xylariomycetidae sp. FL2044]